MNTLTVLTLYFMAALTILGIIVMVISNRSKNLLSVISAITSYTPKDSYMFGDIQIDRIKEDIQATHKRHHAYLKQLLHQRLVYLTNRALASSVTSRSTFVEVQEGMYVDKGLKFNECTVEELMFLAYVTDMMITYMHTNGNATNTDIANIISYRLYMELNLKASKYVYDETRRAAGNFVGLELYNKVNSIFANYLKYFKKYSVVDRDPDPALKSAVTEACTRAILAHIKETKDGSVEDLYLQYSKLEYVDAKTLLSELGLSLEPAKS